MLPITELASKFTFCYGCKKFSWTCSAPMGNRIQTFERNVLPSGKNYDLSALEHDSTTFSRIVGIRLPIRAALRPRIKGILSYTTAKI
jgi:hypothetical protein